MLQWRPDAVLPACLVAAASLAGIGLISLAVTTQAVAEAPEPVDELEALRRTLPNDHEIERRPPNVELGKHPCSLRVAREQLR